MIERQEFRRLLEDPACQADIADLESELTKRATNSGTTDEQRTQALHELWGLQRLITKFASSNSTKRVEQ